MSVFNGERFLAEAIESVLGQTFSDFEFIIVDDGADDDSGPIIDAYAKQDRRVVSLRNPRRVGLTRSLNRALDRARGRFVARQDADDISEKDRLEAQLALFHAHPRTGLVGSAVTVIDENGAPGGVIPAPAHDTIVRWQMLFRNVFKHASVMVRKSVLDDNRLRYDPGMTYAQDYDLWSRMLQSCNGTNVERPLVRFRNHSRQISRRFASEQEGFAVQTSRRNIGRIGIRLDDGDVKRLCRWIQRMPEDLTLDDMRRCRGYFAILAAFRRSRPDLDPQKVGRIRRHLVRHMVRAFPSRRLADLARSGLLGQLIRNDATTVFREPLHRLGVRGPNGREARCRPIP